MRNQDTFHRNNELVFALAMLFAGGCADRIAPDDGTAMDAGLAADAPLMCLDSGLSPPVLTDCDERDIEECGHWPQFHTSATVTSAACLYRPYRCVMASYCARDYGEDAGCMCGEEPACGPGFVCVAAHRGAPFHCECITR